MAKFCTNCGKEIADGIAFCTECGAKAPSEETAAAADPVVTEAPPSALSAGPTCQNCGTPLAEGVAFCTECGTQRDGAAAPAPEPPPSPKQAYVPPQQPYIPPQQTYAQPAQVYQQPVYAQPTPMYAPAPAVDESEKVVGTGAFFGLNFLFGVPVIGWIACILMAFVPKNKNIKHYARAMLIWLLIGAVIAVSLFFALRGLVNLVKEYANDFMEEYTGQTGQTGQSGQSGQSGQIAGETPSGDTGSLFDSLGSLGDLLDQLGGLEGLGDLNNLPTE